MFVGRDMEMRLALPQIQSNRDTDPSQEQQTRLAVGLQSQQNYSHYFN